jgi:ABC-type sugar transport system ATPase subunit
LKEGSEVNMVIRPEIVSLSQQTDNSIEITINTIEYLGNEVKITGTLKDGSLLLVDLEEQTERYSEMKVGDILQAYIFSEKIFVFVDGKRVY